MAAETSCLSVSPKAGGATEWLGWVDFDVSLPRLGKRTVTNTRQGEGR